MLDITPIATSVTTAVVGLAVWLIQEKRKNTAVGNARDGMIEKAMLVLLRNQLVSAHRDSVSRWAITTAELQSFREMHDVYIALGGNGPASHLLEDLERVRLIAD